MSIQTYIESIIAPKLQGDGGWIEFERLDDNELTVVFRGECSKCLILDRCVRWIESEIERELSANIHITAVRQRPYFQDV